MEKNSLLPFFEVLSSKFNFCLFPKNTISRLGSRLPNFSHFAKIGLMFFIFLVSLESFAQTPSSPADCKIGCTSNDVQIQNAYLSDAVGNKLPPNFVCPSSGSATVYLTLELTTKTPRIGVVIYTNIKEFIPPSTIGSSILTTFSQCFGTNLNQPTNKVTFSQPFNWTCGTSIVLTDVFIGWGTGNTNFCTGSGFQCPATSSKCYALPPGQYIAVQTPVANTASATRCSTQPNGTTAVFDLTSLNSTVIGSQTNVDVIWYSDSGLSVNSLIGSATSYTSSSGNIYAKVTSTISPYPYSTSIVTLTVNPTPAVSSAATGSICTGIAQNYDITSAVNGTTYSWSRAAVTGISNTAVSGQTNNPITETLTNTTSAPVDVIYLITPTANGCTGATFTYTVTVNPNPTANAGTAPAAQCAIVSAGNDFNLSGSFSNGTALWTVQGSTGSAEGSVTNGETTTSPTVHVIGVGTVTYLLTVTSNKTPSCGNATSTVTVTVNANPTASAGTVPAAQCEAVSGGNDFNLSGSFSNGTALWTVHSKTGEAEGSVTNGGTTASPTVHVTGVGTVTYLLTVASNQSPSCGNATSTVTVTVNANPTANAGTAPASQCAIVSEGNDFSLSGSFSNGTALWTVQGATGTAEGSVTNGETTASPTVHITGVGTVTYLLTVTSNKNPSCGTATSTVAVTVNPNPTVNAGADFTKTCSSYVDGKQIGEANNDDFTYLWNPSTGLSNSTISNPVADPSITTTYTVTKTNKTTGCSGTDSVTVTVNTDAPDAPTFCAVQPSLCGSAGSLTILSPAAGTGYEYSIDNGAHWQSSADFSNLAAGSVTGIKVKNTTTGCISASADCGASSCASPAKIADPETKATSKITPLKQLEQTSTDTKKTSTATNTETSKTETSKTETAGFDVFPVPFKDQLTIKYKFDYESDVKMEVFNAQGILILSKMDTNSYLNKEIALDLKFNKGKEQVYVVKVTTNKESIVKKVMSSQ